jgi:cellulose synthase/poly-beta-1,6-N-acetylglucosamine synthase-like glycosyltransferase
MDEFGVTASRSILARPVRTTRGTPGIVRRFAPSRDSFERLLVSLQIVPSNAMAGLIRTARAQGVSLLQLVARSGVAREDDIYGALATYHHLPFLSDASQDFRPCIKPSEIESCLAVGWIRLKARDGRRIIAAAPDNASLTTLRHLAIGKGRVDPFDAITTPSAIRRWIERHHGALLLEHAVRSLADETPEFSAECRLAPGQRTLAISAALVTIAAIMALPGTVLIVLLFALTSAVFMGAALHRLITFACEIGGRRRPAAPGPMRDQDLPVYTVLVPLYREAHMVREIVTSVLRLDYPRAKLDIKLILEADDADTRAAADGLDLPGCVEIIIVPVALPRTKPKALNYALTFARGSFVTIYDAEDQPDPDQLRRALAEFATRGPQLACLQSRLCVRNARDGWLARQFAVEYSGHFNVIIPGLDRLGQPLLLGGTSNHFRMEALRRIGGWDPFNVTEDADIGVRLARHGYRAATLDSETREEAPTTLGNWMRQRTRWLRGWIQTYLVHMRDPARLARELGPGKFVSLQIQLLGVIVSALVHPFFVAYIAYAATVGALYAPVGAPLLDALLLISAVNLLVGYGVVMEVNVLGLYRAGRAHLLADVLIAPIYWMLISLAAYAAIVRLAISPFTWEKTNHRGQTAAANRSARPGERVPARS